MYAFWTFDTYIILKSTCKYREIYGIVQMKASVVMCTYNGASHIYFQLKTINNQTRKPDEVIIQDDGSTDNTVNIVRKFIADNSLQDSWTLYENPINLGWKKNFMDALSKTSADIIFLSDQDDIWDEKKIEIMSGIMEKDDKIELLVSKHDPFADSTGNRVNIYQPDLGEGLISKVPLYGAFTECRRPGCTYAISNKLIKYIDGLWQEDWPHDQFFWCITMARGSLYSYNEPLVRFRRHEGTNTPSNEKRRTKRVSIIQKDLSIAEMIKANYNKLEIDDDSRKTIEIAAEVYAKRISALMSKNPFKVFALHKYRDYYPRAKAWMGDLVSVLRT